MAEKVSVPVAAPAPPPPAKPHVALKVTTGQPTPGAPDPLQHARVQVTPEAAPAAPPAAGDRPAWLPPKFDNPEALAKAYGELEQRLGQGAPAPAPAPAAPAPNAPSPEAPAKGADLVARMTQEYASSGEVSAATREAFVKQTGLPASYIDNQISYLRAQGERIAGVAAQRLGGEGAVKELLEWAGNRLTESERAAFNRAVYSSDEAMAQLAVDGLAAKYEAEVGRAPRIIAGRKPQDAYRGVVPFQSHAEWTAARREPQYKTDPAYRQQVEDRLRAAMDLGLI